MESTYKDLPVEELFIKDVFAMGIVERAANLRDDIMLFSLDDNTVPLLFKKDDIENQVITGIAMVPNLKIYRGGANPRYVWFSEDTIKQAALLFFKNHHQNTTTLNHEVNVNGNTVFESWFVEDPEMDKTKALGFKDVVKGSWAISMKVEDKDIWNDYIKTGMLKGFSIEMDPLKFNKNNEEKMTLKNILNFFSGKQVEEFEDQSEVKDMQLFALDFINGDSKVAVDDMWIATIDGELLSEGEMQVSTPDKAADFILTIGTEGKVLMITTPHGVAAGAEVESPEEEVIVEETIVEDLAVEEKTEDFSAELEESKKLIETLNATIEAMKMKTDEPLNIKSKSDKWVEEKKESKPNLKKILTERKKK
jgi:hypothetical protein